MDPRRIARLPAAAATLALLLVAHGTGHAAAFAAKSGTIPAPSRADIAYDPRTFTLYISGGSSVLRYDLASGNFLTPLVLGGSTLGMDISADGKTLAVANAAKSGSQIVIDLIDLASQTNRRVAFDAVGPESGTFAVAFDKDGKLLVTSLYAGSGWTPLRGYDPATATTTILASLVSPTMVSPSGDHTWIGVATGNSSSGPYGTYKTGDSGYGATADDGWYQWEVAISPTGDQIALTTEAATYFDDAHSIFPQVGTFAGASPIGAAYAPTGHSLYLAMAETDTIVEYDTRTMKTARSIKVPKTFGFVGSNAFVDGRVKVASDASALFCTIAGGVFYTSLNAKP